MSAVVKHECPEINVWDLERIQNAIHGFRVNELHILLSDFPKIGEKRILVSEAISLLNDPNHQLEFWKKVCEVIQVAQSRRKMEALINSYRMQFINENKQDDQNYKNNRKVNNAIRSTPLQTNNGQQDFLKTSDSKPSKTSTGFSAPRSSHSQKSNALPHWKRDLHVNGLRTVDLPFYHVVKAVISHTELNPVCSIVKCSNKSNEKLSFHSKYQRKFFISDDLREYLCYNDKDRKLPRLEIQLRMFLLNKREEQKDAFPLSCVIKIDDQDVKLPNYIPTNDRLAEPKRLSRPVNLTPYCQPPRDRFNPHTIQIYWTSDERLWAYSVSIVRRIDSEMLFNKIRKNPKFHYSFERAKASFVRRHFKSKNDIQMDTLKVCLLDPLARTRIALPCRSLRCTHLQCFDLHNYLKMNEKNPSWKCPVCNKSALSSELIIDGYFNELLMSNNGREEVELLSDGSWVRKESTKLSTNESDDDEIICLSPPKKPKIASALLETSVLSAFNRNRSKKLTNKVSREQIRPTHTTSSSGF